MHGIIREVLSVPVGIIIVNFLLLGFLIGIMFHSTLLQYMCDRVFKYEDDDENDDWGDD